MLLSLSDLQRQLLGVLGDKGERKSSLSVMAGNQDDDNAATDDDDDDDGQPFTPWNVSVARSSFYSINSSLFYNLPH